MKKPHRMASHLPALMMWVVAWILVTGHHTQAQLTSPRISYQGMLQKGDGSSFTGGAATIYFRIYDQNTGGNLMWSESQSVLMDTNGLFNVELGTDNVVPGDSPTNTDDISKVFVGTADSPIDQRYLELQVKDSTPIAPRQRFLAAPYALAVANISQAAGDFAVVGTLTAESGAGVKGTLTADSATVSGTSTVGVLKVNTPTSAAGLTITGGTASPDLARIQIGDGTGMKLHLSNTKPQDVVTFMDTGRVGINQSNPAVALDVNGTVQATNFVFSASATKPFMIRHYSLSQDNVQEYVIVTKDKHGNYSTNSTYTGSNFDTGIKTADYSAIIGGTGIRGGVWAVSGPNPDNPDSSNINFISEFAMRTNTATATWAVMARAGLSGVILAAGVDVLFIRRDWVDDQGR